MLLSEVLTLHKLAVMSSYMAKGADDKYKGLSYKWVSLKVTTQKFYSHCNGAHPTSGDDSDEARKDRRVDVVLHMVAVICISKKSLDCMREKNIV